MGCPIGQEMLCAKGAVPHGLDTISSMPDARARLERLRNAIIGLAPGNYAGLEVVFEEHVLRPIYSDAKEAAKVTAHLKRNWFDQASPDAFFPDTPVAEIYAEGVLTAIELSLKGESGVVPIDAWWIVDQQDVKMVQLARVDQGVTKGSTVILLILTPRPHPALQKGPMVILNKEAVVWISEQTTTRGRVAKRKTP